MKSDAANDIGANRQIVPLHPGAFALSGGCANHGLNWRLPSEVIAFRVCCPQGQEMFLKYGDQGKMGGRHVSETQGYLEG